MSRKGENITKRKDGRWEARAILSRDEHGKAVYSFFYGKTYAEAKAKKEYALSQVIMCVPRVPKNALTVQELIGEFLLHKRSAVKASTLAHYESLIRGYLSDALGSLNLMQLTAVKIEQYAQLLLTGGNKHGDGLSPKTVRDILSVLRSACKYGVARRYLPADILDFSMPRAEQKETPILKPSEQKILEGFTENEHNTFKFGVYLTLYTGLRIGEICALRWSDIDFEQSTLSVRRTIQRIKPSGSTKTAIRITEPKTQTSMRSIPLPRFLLVMLAAKKKGDEVYILTGSAHYIGDVRDLQSVKNAMHGVDYIFH